MIKVFKGWIDRYLSDPEAILLLVLLIAGLVIIKTFGNILMPVFVSIAIAILLQFWVNFLEKHNCPPTVAYWIVYIIFLTIFFGSLVFLLPLMWREGINLASELPTIFQNTKSALMDFIKSKQDYVSEQYIDALSASMLTETQTWGKNLISFSLASIPGLITLVVYLILVPLLVFFFLQDHEKILAWFKSFLPEKRGLIRKIWFEMNEQVGNYVRGKLTEIFIVFVFTYLVFVFFGLHYSLLLASLVGLSVVIPYIGAVVATIPVILVGYFQWGFAGGFTGEFALMFYSYLFVQFVDGNIIVPLLFSEAVNLHPIAIIVAILFFGSLWGFWGVFFAIPLATLVKSIINAWPSQPASRSRHA